ncbi:MAG: 50S ribosomal protein L10 [Peptoniphilaceae bacterium]|nr:50S ribosomal protein L10 [Peptoniphilaceae bacterium]
MKNLKEQTLQKKQAVIDEIKEQIQNAKSVTVLGYSGINVADVTELRGKYRQSDVVYKVYKNTMVSRAFHELGYEDMDDLLAGPNAFAFSMGEMVDGPKISHEFAKDHEQQFTIKGGFMDGKRMSADEVVALSKLPGKEVLLSMVLRGLQGPIAGLANVSQGVLRSVVYALNAIKEKKENEAA